MPALSDGLTYRFDLRQDVYFVDDPSLKVAKGGN